MKQCPNCHAQMGDNVAFCTNCGAPLAAAPNQNNAYARPVMRGDHTAEFDPADIAASKPMAMLVYLAGWIGIFAGLLSKKNSPYLQFHIGQALKLKVLSAFTMMIAVPVYVILDMLTMFLPYKAVAILPTILVFGIIVAKIIFRLISFMQVSSGKAVESSIANSMSFLK